MFQTMKGIQLTSYGNSDQAFTITELPIPKPGDYDVIIASEASGLNFADVVARRGLYPDAPKNPALLGYDVAGRIHTIGAKVEDFKVGDRVTALCRFGGYAEYVSTNVAGVAKVPDSLDYPEATTLATQACTAMFCATEAVSLHPSDKVLVQAAAGGVGIMLTQIAKHLGCEVFGTCSTSKLDFVKKNGVDHAIDYRNENFAEAIRTLIGKRGIDVIFDSLGGKAYKDGKGLLAHGGRMVNFGAAEQIRGSKTNKIGALRAAWRFGFHSPIPLLMGSKAMIGVNMLRISDSRPDIFNVVLKRVVDYYEQGILKPVVSKVFSAEQIAEAHDHLENRQSIGKVAIVWK